MDANVTEKNEKVMRQAVDRHKDAPTCMKLNAASSRPVGGAGEQPH